MSDSPAKSWTDDDYAEAKSLLDHYDVEPERRAKLAAAVADYDAAYRAVPAPRPEFEEPPPAVAPPPVTSAAQVSRPRAQAMQAPLVTAAAEPPPEPAEPPSQSYGGGMGVPPPLIAMRRLANLPETAWQGFKESASDALTSFTNRGTFSAGDKLLEALGREDDADAFREQVKAAHERSPVGSFAGGLVPDAAYAAAATALGASPSAAGGLVEGVQALGETGDPVDAAVRGATAWGIGRGLEAVPGVAKWTGEKLASMGRRAGELGEEYFARAMGGTASDINNIISKPGGRERLRDYINTWKEQGLDANKLGVIPPSVRDVGERATAAAQLAQNKKDAIEASLGGQALVDPLALQNRVRKLKGKHASGGPAGQPLRDTIDETAEKFAQMNMAEREPFAYHTTPSENMQDIAANGLRPAEGGKNYGLKKNLNTTYFGVDAPGEPIDQSMRKWVSEVPDLNAMAAGRPRDMTLLRTTAPVQTPVEYGPQGQVIKKGGNTIRIRREPTPVDQIEYLDPTERVWRPVDQYGQPQLPRGEAPLSYERPAPNWFEDEQPLLALAEDAGPSSAGTSSALTPRRPEVYADAQDVTPSGLPMGNGTLANAEPAAVGGANVHARADVFPPSDPNAALAQRPSTEWSVIDEPEPYAPGSVTAEMIDATTVPRARRGITFEDMKKEKRDWGNATNFPSDAPQQKIRRGVYDAINSEMAAAAEAVMPGSGQAWRNQSFNEHAALTAQEWAQKRALRESNNRVVSPSDLGAGMLGGIAGLATGNPVAGVGLGAVINRAVRGREHAVGSKVMGAISGGGTRGQSTQDLARALKDWSGRPVLSQNAGIAGSEPAVGAVKGLFGAAAQDEESQERKAASDNGRGHLSADAARKLLQENPKALGAYAGAWQKALDSNDPTKVNALMTSLERDPLYKNTVRKLIEQQTARKQ